MSDLRAIQLPPPILRRAERLEMPVLYAQACKALELCVTMDEAKYYADKSDALAAWAKIHGSDRDKLAAIRLKNHAYARMGQLAQEIRPQRLVTDKGPKSLLLEHGISENNAIACRKLAKLPKEEIEKITVAPSTWAQRNYHEKASVGWNTVAHGGHGSLVSFRSFCRNNDAIALASNLAETEIGKARTLIAELAKWIASFSSALPT